MFEDIKRSPVGKDLICCAEQSKLVSLRPEELFDVEAILFPEPCFAEAGREVELAALKAAQLAVMSRCGYSTWQDLMEAFDLCGSPIERQFLSALIIVVKDQAYEIVIHGPDGTYLGPPRPCAPVLHVVPQMRIGGCRVDFLLVWQEPETPGLATPGQPGEPKRRQAALVVECDGHEFHEKTKEQASRDKERDRMLQSRGFNVFRFSGADIYRRPIQCAEECLRFLQEKVEGGAALLGA